MSNRKRNKDDKRLLLVDVDVEWTAFVVVENQRTSDESYFLSTNRSLATRRGSGAIALTSLPIRREIVYRRHGTKWNVSRRPDDVTAPPRHEVFDKTTQKSDK